MKSNPFRWPLLLLYSHTDTGKVKVTKFKRHRTTKGARRVYKLVRSGAYSFNPCPLGALKTVDFFRATSANSH